MRPVTLFDLKTHMNTNTLPTLILTGLGPSIYSRIYGSTHRKK